MKTTKFAFVLGLAPLLMAPDYAKLDDFVAHQHKVSTTTIPVCKTGEFLVVADASTLICQTIGATSGLASKKCDTQLLTGTISGDTGLTLSCTPKGSDSFSSGDITTINQMDTTLKMIELLINNLQMNPPGAASVYIGSTTAMTTGSIVSNGKSGILGAADMCNTQYPGSHMCTVYEMYISAAVPGTGINKFPTAADVPKAWVYQQSFNPATFGAGLSGATASGLGDNCNGYTSAANTPATMFGMAVNFTTVAFTAKKALKFYGGVDGACNQNLPVACCK